MPGADARPLPPNFHTLTRREQAVWLYVDRHGPEGTSVRPSVLKSHLGGAENHYTTLIHSLTERHLLIPVGTRTDTYCNRQFPHVRSCQPHEYGSASPKDTP